MSFHIFFLKFIYLYFTFFKISEIVKWFRDILPLLRLPFHLFIKLLAIIENYF